MNGGMNGTHETRVSYVALGMRHSFLEMWEEYKHLEDEKMVFWDECIKMARLLVMEYEDFDEYMRAVVDDE